MPHFRLHLLEWSVSPINTAFQTNFNLSAAQEILHGKLQLNRPVFSHPTYLVEPSSENRI
jgi:hypothetical protein